MPTGTIAITNARIITLNKRAVIESGTILVKGSRIACVGTCSTAGVDRVVDAAGKTRGFSTGDNITAGDAARANEINSPRDALAMVTKMAGWGATYSPTLVVAGPSAWSIEYWFQESDVWKDPKQRKWFPWRALGRHGALEWRRCTVRDASAPTRISGVSKSGNWPIS